MIFIVYCQGGGCDGCLNMDEDVKDNMELQHTIAVLEKVYMEADFPTQVDSLEASPKDLGISRADLWAFAGLASVDTFLTHTRDVCNNVKAKILNRGYILSGNNDFIDRGWSDWTSSPTDFKGPLYTILAIKISAFPW